MAAASETAEGGKRIGVTASQAKKRFEELLEYPAFWGKSGSSEYWWVLPDWMIYQLIRLGLLRN